MRSERLSRHRQMIPHWARRKCDVCQSPVSDRYRVVERARVTNRDTVDGQARRTCGSDSIIGALFAGQVAIDTLAPQLIGVTSDMVELAKQCGLSKHHKAVKLCLADDGRASNGWHGRVIRGSIQPHKPPRREQIVPFLLFLLFLPFLPFLPFLLFVCFFVSGCSGMSPDDQKHAYACADVQSDSTEACSIIVCLEESRHGEKKFFRNGGFFVTEVRSGDHPLFFPKNPLLYHEVGTICMGLRSHGASMLGPRRRCQGSCIDGPIREKVHL